MEVLRVKKICMVVQDKAVKGGIAAVVNGYRGSTLEKKFDITYIESYKDGNKITKFIKGLLGYFDFLKILISNRPELVHIHSSFGPSFYRKIPFILIAEKYNIPVINHIHGADFDEFYRGASRSKKELIKFIYNKCSKLIALSPEWEECLKLIVPQDRIIVIENYSTLYEEETILRQERQSNNTVLFLGELGKRKGCYDIPSVLEKVVRKVPNVLFVLGGSGNPNDELAIKSLFSDKMLDSHVCFPGWVRGQEKEKMLRDADIFFLPSYNEGMPMSILDAMGYGLPVVSTNVGGIPKIVKNGINGYCCEPGDVESFSKAISSMLLDCELLKLCGSESFNIVRENYSLENHLQNLEKLYNNL